MIRSMPPERGFSLIELVLVLGIISVMAAIAGPRYFNSLMLYRAQAAAQRVAADVNLACRLARTSSLGQTIVFNTTTNAYSLPGVAGLPGTTSPYTVKLASEPYSGTLVSAVFGNAQTLTFDRYGQPAAGGTITVKSGTVTKTITVDPDTGQATVQ